MNQTAKNKLTKAQVAILQVAREHGHAFAETCCRQRASVARERMVIRLRDLGLLTWSGPYRITEKGLAVLSTLDSPRAPH